MIRNDKWLHLNAAAIGLPPAQINPVSCDVTLGGHIIEFSKKYGGFFDWPLKQMQRMLGDPEVGSATLRRVHDLADGTPFTFIPGRSYLCHTREYTTIPANCAALLLLKSSAGRRGLDHAFSGYGDSGFSGQWTLELTAHRPATFAIGDRVAQLVFMACEEPERGYQITGHYQHQVGATEARIF